LGEEDEGWCGNFVDGIFVGDEECGGAEHVTAHGEGGCGVEGSWIHVVTVGTSCDSDYIIIIL